MTQPTGPTKVVTFYSYKGGVGRTMALVNTAYTLAREGWRVLMVDCDLEAPGITHFFAREVRSRPEQVHKDVLDLLLDAKRSLAETDLYQRAADYPRSLAEYVVPVALPDAWLEQPGKGIPYRNGRLDLIPATLEPRRTEVEPEAQPSPDYLERLSELDLPGLFLPGGLGHIFGDHVRKHFVSARFEAPGDILFTLRDPVQAAYDVVLIDSRTGLNEFAGFSIGTVADSLVICCGLNQQNIEGTRYFMRKAGLFDKRAKRFLVAVGPIPPWQRPEVNKRLQVLRQALYLRQDIGKSFEDMLGNFDEESEKESLGIAYDFPEMVEIPYHPQAAIRETVFVIEQPRDPIAQAYTKLAARVRSRLLPGALEAAVGHFRFLDLLHKPGKRGLQDFCDFSAQKLPELRLLRKQSTLIPAFPTSCGIISLPKLQLGEWEDLGQIPVGAAVSALKLSSPEPFERAWALLQGIEAQEYRRRSIGDLIYFQSSTPFPVPASAMEWLTISDYNLFQEKTYSGFSSYLAFQALASHYPEQFQAEKVSNVSPGIATILRLDSNSTLRWLRAPASRDSIFRLAKAVETLARGTLHEDLTSLEFLSNFYALPAAPSQVLSGEMAMPTDSMDLEFDRSSYSNTPLGFWPEPLAATAVALLKGPEAIQEILAWLRLARLHYGYAWRVLVDWRYFEDVKQHPDFQDFLRQEDEVVQDIETAIDRGEIPL